MRTRFSAAIGSILLSLALCPPLHAQNSGTWATLAPMSEARQEHATAVLNGKVYVIGGYAGEEGSSSTVQVYTPGTNTWGYAASIPFPNNHNGAAVAAGKLYSFGGISRRAFVYDPASDSWGEVASMNFQHALTPAVGVFNEKIYVAGGSQGGSSLRNLEVYDPAANTWTNLRSMSVARNHCAGAFIDGKFYVAGGRGSPNAGTALEVYDPQTNNWSTRASMPTGRSGIAAGAVEGELFVFGGEIPGVFEEVEAYNPVTNSWRALPDMPSPRHGIWAAVIGNRIYLPGGGAVENISSTTVHEVFIVGEAGEPATFANISTRGLVLTGDNVLIGGFIVSGNVSKRVVLRAVGPSLPVPGALPDPTLSLHDANGQLVTTNDNWQDAPNRQEIVDSRLAPPSPQDAAILTQVAPGAHTAIVRGANGSVGVSLVEVYDLESGSASRLANISTRGFVQTGDNVLIGGLILTGSEPRRVIVRAIGPSLPVPTPLADPTLSLHDANGALVVSNDNWRDTQEAEIAGALPPPSAQDAAVVRTFAAGAYTAIVRGAGGTSGVALVEAYALD